MATRVMRAAIRPPPLAQHARERLARTSRTGRVAVLGVLAAMGLMAGTGTYLALLASPYKTDESSHVGYALSLREGRLPDIDTDVPTGRGGPELEAALTRPWPFSVPEIHVGQNPPFPYAAAVPSAEATAALDVRAGPLLGVRMLNVLGGVGAVAAAGLLGRELGGRDPLVGVATAGMLAGLVSVSALVAVANLDGVALFTTTGTAWALARYARTRSLRGALLLGGWAAAAAATRPMALAVAGIAGIVAAVLALQAHGWRRSGGHLVRMAGPPAVLAGWFYVLNIVRYGDPTGASAVYEKYGYEGTRSMWDILWGPEPFIQTVPYLFTEVYGSRPWWTSTGARQYLLAALAVGVVLAAIALAARDRRAALASTAAAVGRGSLCVASWVSVAILAAVPMFLISRHMSRGGAGHARYLLPTVPIVLAAVAVLLARVHRWLPVVAVAVAAVAHLARIDDAGRTYLPDTRITPEILRAALVGQPYRGLALVVAAAGAVACVGALAVLARARGAPRPVAPDDAT